MSRRRWIALLGPPLLGAVAAMPGLAAGRGLNLWAISPPEPPLIGACSPLAPDKLQAGTRATTGTWWRTEPSIDAAGSLEAWTFLVGGPGVATSTLHLPAPSTVTGPTRGRVVVASEEPAGDAGSIVRIVDVARGCATEIRIADRIARRAIAHPDGNGLLVHLLEPVSRRDLGVWRVTLDGRVAERILEPVGDAVLAAAGIDRVWATDLRLDGTGWRLAVQSCHPDACVTRIVSLVTGDLETLAREGQGPIVGFSGRELVSWAACHGFPCPVVAWDLAAGSGRTLALDASGAALSADGRLLLIVRARSGVDVELTSIDVRTGVARRFGPGGPEIALLSGAAGLIAGMEVAGASVAIGHPGRAPSALALDEAAGITPPEHEVQP